MEDILKLLVLYIVCLFFVSACWVGLEYILEGVVHNSDVDGVVSVVLSYFVAEKLFDWRNGHDA